MFSPFLPPGRSASLQHELGTAQNQPLRFEGAFGMCEGELMGECCEALGGSTTPVTNHSMKWSKAIVESIRVVHQRRRRGPFTAIRRDQAIPERSCGLGRSDTTAPARSHCQGR